MRWTNSSPWIGIAAELKSKDASTAFIADLLRADIEVASSLISLILVGVVVLALVVVLIFMRRKKKGQS